MDYDVVVIGSGPGGYVAAIRAAQLGLKVACVEKASTYGGTCLNVGCIPSKALLQSSESFEFAKKGAEEQGVSCKDVTFDFEKMMQRKEGIVDGSVKGIEGLFKKNQITAIHGSAKFIAKDEIEIANEKQSSRLKAKNFILATGSEPIPLPFLPFDEKIVLSSTGALSLKKAPKKMVVIGAGVIGVEIASVYNRLGTEVIVIEMLDKICPAMDNAVGRALQQSLKKQGFVFHLSSKVTEAKVDKQNVSVKFESGGETHQINADAVLVAIGRRPYSEGLGLEQIGVKQTKGFVNVDALFRTNVPHIFAIGDLIEGPMLAHRASEEGVAAAELIAGLKPHVNYMGIPNVIYTHPEVAALGLTEEEAKEKRLSLLVGMCSFRANPRARCLGDTDGFVKIIGEKNSGRLIGLHIIGHSASELIAEGVIAIEKKATLEDIARACHAHPTLSEWIKEAALVALARPINL